MKILLVHIGPIFKYPPALTVLQYLNDLGIETILCTTDIDSQTAELCAKRGVKVKNIVANYERTISPFLKLFRLIKIKKALWKEIDNIYDSETSIWVFSDLALKHLGKRLLKKRFILHMFELNEKTLYYRKLPLLALNTALYAKKAVCVIQAEYNRAHISKAWWDLEKLPYILPNKPYSNNEIKKYSHISNQKASIIINKLKGKKIILYQGILSPERPLDVFIKAVNKLGEDYAFVVMSGGENIYKDIGSENFYFIPYIANPYHLEVTSHAYIGVLTYVPTNNEFSMLNALYCAPNKLYEYSKFGIPMIGNDVPGLSYAFNTSGCGVCFETFEESNVISAIKAVEKNYDFMAAKSKEFYNKVDIKGTIKEIVDSIDC
ncbi:hypothetical protein [Bacillus sp. V59.32b]|uniref:hypothetical protein n=1 Tax=Bacillus sp. V59.32b TaxID=1758642 RepID=UPI000E3DE699|nr:hypothetical protein [Bacillus sp. V59.32b]RFU60991.1 hypothetical protein D0463_15640 [Bacillus sp. V59.32b]